MPKYNFGNICVVPQSEHFVDIILSRTNRQTPTVVRARWKISSIRTFYMRKVKFTQQNFVLRLNQMLDEFPRLDSIHPFYSDLMNVLYDRDHYKIALSQINIAKQLIGNIGRDYIKLLKYGDSLYRCKNLKRAALGRMAKIIRQQKPALAYLEQVRQHLSRLPSIDPYERTLLLTGFPNTGKSSFLNKVSKADVEVKSYPFTTKSLFVGHCDHSYLRWQIIDSPGVLDRNLNERNTIEMQAITALAHLNACVLFFVDLSPLANYSIQQQIQLFFSLQPLLHEKPVIVVCNKIDLRRFEQLSNEEKNAILKISKVRNVKVMKMSNETEENVMEVRNAACDLLLLHRMHHKSNESTSLQRAEKRLFVAYPMKRDNKQRPSVQKPLVNKSYQSVIEMEAQMGGAGVYNFDVRQHWNLEKDEWKFDPIPKIYNGKNISDFYHANVERDLQTLEEEEEKAMHDELEVEHEHEQQTLVNDSDSDLDADHEMLAKYIQRKHILIRSASARKRKVNDTRAIIARPNRKMNIKDLEQDLGDLGIKTQKVRRSLKQEWQQRERHRTFIPGGKRSKTEKAFNKGNEPQSGIDLQRMSMRSRSIHRSGSRPFSRSALRSQSRDRRKNIQFAKVKGSMNSLNACQSALLLKKQAMKNLNRRGIIHPSDKYVDKICKKPIHLFKGKGNKGR